MIFRFIYYAMVYRCIYNAMIYRCIYYAMVCSCMYQVMLWFTVVYNIILSVDLQLYILCYGLFYCYVCVSLYGSILFLNCVLYVLCVFWAMFFLQYHRVLIYVCLFNMVFTFYSFLKSVFIIQILKTTIASNCIV